MLLDTVCLLAILRLLYDVGWGEEVLPSACRGIFTQFTLLTEALFCAKEMQLTDDS